MNILLSINLKHVQLYSYDIVAIYISFDSYGMAIHEQPIPNEGLIIRLCARCIFYALWVGETQPFPKGENNP